MSDAERGELEHRYKKNVEYTYGESSTASPMESESKIEVEQPPKFDANKFLPVEGDAPTSVTVNVPPTEFKRRSSGNWWRPAKGLALLQKHFPRYSREEKETHSTWEEGPQHWPEVEVRSEREIWPGGMYHHPGHPQQVLPPFPPPQLKHGEGEVSGDAGMDPVGEDMSSIVRRRNKYRTFLPGLLQRASSGLHKERSPSSRRKSSAHADNSPSNKDKTSRSKPKSAEVTRPSSGPILMRVATTCCNSRGSFSATSLPTCSAPACDPCDSCPEKCKTEAASPPCPEKNCCYGQLWITQMMADCCYQDVFVRATLREFLIYLIFLLSILFMSVGNYDPGAFHYGNGLRKLLLQTPFPVGTCCKTFYQISTFSEMNKYLTTVYVNATTDDQRFRLVAPVWDVKHKDLQAASDKKCDYIIGVPRVRMVKVMNRTCTIPIEFQDMFNTCYGYFTKRTEVVPSYPEQGLCVYQANGGTRYDGKLGSYGPGGFCLNITQPTQWMLLQKADVLGQQIRVVFVTSLHYSPCSNLFLLTKLVMEVTPSGNIVPSAHFYPIKMLWYVSVLDFIILGAQFVVGLFIFWYLAQVLRELAFFGCCFFRLPWGMFTLVLVIVGLMWVITCIVTYLVTFKTLGKLLFGAFKYHGYYPNAEYLVRLHTILNGFLSLLTFLAIIMVFKYLQIFRTFYIIALAISNATWPLVGCIFLILLVVLAFTAFGNLAFGTQLEEFSYFPDAYYTVFSMLIGCYDFSLLRKTNSFMGPIFLYLFGFIVVFICLTLFFVVLMHGYSEAKCSDCLVNRIFFFDYLRCMQLRAKKDSCCEEICKELTCTSTRDKSYTCCFQIGGPQRSTLDGQNLSFDMVRNKIDRVDKTCNQLLDKLNTMTKKMSDGDK